MHVGRRRCELCFVCGSFCIRWHGLSRQCEAAVSRLAWFHGLGRGCRHWRVNFESPRSCVASLSGASSRNVVSKLKGWRARVRRRSKYDSHTYLDPHGKEYKGKGEVRIGDEGREASVSSRGSVFLYAGLRRQVGVIRDRRCCCPRRCAASTALVDGRSFPEKPAAARVRDPFRVVVAIVGAFGSWGAGTPCLGLTRVGDSVVGGEVRGTSRILVRSRWPESMPWSTLPSCWLK